MTDAIITTWPSLLETHGRTLYCSWPYWFEELRKPAPFAGDRKHPGWAPAEIVPADRANDNVRRLTALCLDYDGGTTIAEAVETWRGRYGLLHTTRKHTPAAPRFRVILPYGRHLAPDEHAKVFQWAMRKTGGKLDKATKDAARFWFLPGAADLSTFEVHDLAGEALGG